MCYKHSFVVEESRCRTGLDDVQTSQTERFGAASNNNKNPAKTDKDNLTARIIHKTRMGQDSPPKNLSNLFAYFLDLYRMFLKPGGMLRIGKHLVGLLCSIGNTT